MLRFKLADGNIMLASIGQSTTAGTCRVYSSAQSQLLCSNSSEAGTYCSYNGACHRFRSIIAPILFSCMPLIYSRPKPPINSHLPISSHRFTLVTSPQLPRLLPPTPSNIRFPPTPLCNSQSKAAISSTITVTKAAISLPWYQALRRVRLLPNFLAGYQRCSENTCGGSG